MKRALILCAGQAQRFDGIVKQLIPLTVGETILSRMIRQLHNRGFVKDEIHVVVAPESQEIYNALKSQDVMAAVSRQNFGNTHTALMTKDLWVDNTFILLGDVVYSQQVMDTIVSHEKDIVFFGDIWEIFGVQFTDHKLAETAFKHGMLHKKRKLRHAYRGLIKVDLDRKENPRTLKQEKHFCYTDCWITRDIDTYGEYVNLLNELVYNGALAKDQ